MRYGIFFELPSLSSALTILSVSVERAFLAAAWIRNGRLYITFTASIASGRFGPLTLKNSLIMVFAALVLVALLPWTIQGHTWLITPSRSLLARSPKSIELHNQSQYTGTFQP